MNAKRPRVTANRHAENAYARDLRVIMAEVHKAHLRELGIRRDGPNLDVLGIQIQMYVRRETGKAFDRMAARVDKTNADKLRALQKAGGYDYEYRHVPISEIVFPAAGGATGRVKGVPPVWAPSKLEALRKTPQLPPVSLTTVGTGGELRLIDGIHRSAVALERGQTMIPAIIQHQKGKSPVGAHVTEIRSPRDLVDRFREANISLMERASRSYADDVRRVLAENPGARVEDLADQIKERAGVSDSRADLIARDQTLKLNGQLNQARQQNAGVTQYEWSTSHDSHVRDTHAELDGQTFSWNDPPVTNDKGDRNHPGEDFQCRCVAIPVVDELEGV